MFINEWLAFKDNFLYYHQSSYSIKQLENKKKMINVNGGECESMNIERNHEYDYVYSLRNLLGT